MNNNFVHDNTGAAETLNLSEENSASAEGIVSTIKAFLKKIRYTFAQKSEKSILAAFLQNLYVNMLVGKIRVAAVFLLTFSFVSLAISYITNTSIGGFISDIDTFSSIVLLIIGFVFFTTNKSLYSLISTSKILGSLSIVYNDSNLFFTDENDSQSSIVYSTPFFLGIICGIFTVIYPASVICTFIISLICVLLIFNRPECGLLFMVAVLPLLGREFLLIFVFVTFFTLLYKYLLGKRHVNFNLSTAIIVISLVFVTIRSIYDSGDTFSVRYCSHLLFYISCLSAMNLIRSTAMFRRMVLILIRMTRVFAVILVAYYLCNMFFGVVGVSRFMQLLNIESLIHSVTSSTFAAPFLAMSVPLNFAYLVGINKKNETAKNTFFVVLLLASLIYVSSYSLILISILSCVAILIFFNKKYGFLIIPAPFAAYALQKIFNAVPSMYRISAASESATDINTAIEIIKANPLFGAGSSITDYKGNMMLNVLITFGFVGLVLLAVLIVSMTIKSIKSISADTMKSDKARFLSIGLLCAQLSFTAICIFTDIYCNMNVIFMFAIIMTTSFVSGKCYEADYIDATIVREYKNK